MLHDTTHSLQVHPSSCFTKNATHNASQALFHPRAHYNKHTTRFNGPIRAVVPVMTAGPVLVHDGAAAAAPASPQQLLAEHRQWSYTTALLRRGHSVVDWELHLERLVRNIQLLGRQRPPAYAAFLAWLQQQPPESSPTALLDSITRPQVAQALNILAAQQPQQQQADGMVTVLVTDQQDNAAKAQAGVQAPLSVFVWAKHLPPPSGAVKPAKVLVAGAPRDLAQAKHCDWVVARQPLEQLRQQAGVDEVLLSDSSGALLEGLVTSWYVIADKAALQAFSGSDAAAAVDGVSPDGQVVRPSSSSDSAGSGVTDVLVLLTAGSGHAALLGISQQRVLQACHCIGLEVAGQPPQLAHHPAWREAFISNCVKGIQPVTSVQLDSGTVWEAPAGAGSVTHLLQQKLVQLQTMTDMSVGS